jgi:GNAT superfamily N-acetyltransferase
MEPRPEITVSKVEREDTVWKASFKSFYSGCWVKKLGRKAHAYFAAYVGGQLAGHCVIYKNKDRWIMDGLLVKPEFREMGVAKRLTEARIRYAAAQGAKQVWYSCEDGNLVTICCHLRYGFRKICPPGHHCTAATAHWFRLDLTPDVFLKFPAIRP